MGTVRYYKNRGSGFPAQMKPQETTPAKTASTDNGQRWIHTLQQTGDMLARHLDGWVLDASRTPQPMHEDSQGSRS